MDTLNVARLGLGIVACSPVVGLAAAGSFGLVERRHAVDIWVDPSESKVVQIAAGLFADDVATVTGVKPSIVSVASKQKTVVLVGTLGHSKAIDQLAQAGKLPEAAKIRGKWEATLWQVVEKPFPGIDRALVVAGSDRRGTAYGLMNLSQQVGVSPWTWWADVAPQHKDAISIRVPQSKTDAPAVKYRGIFINDEDWGLHQWASKKFEPETGCIGPKTYRKVFELLLRLRLNYIWPAMHNCTKAFHDIAENVQLADDYGIVAGASHCEAMLFNNATWDVKTGGKWDYTINKERIFGTWEQSAKTRGDKEAVWTLGIRGIHDQGMQGPSDTATRIKIVSQVFEDQRGLLNRYVSKDWGPIAQCFVPYKEVLPLYDAGLKVPDDVTLVWVDDNFGYIRRLSSPDERQRSGGAGIYWHLSYYGGPHSYLWINSTAPALIWEEFHKAWENQARNLWVINVGDIKPMEIGVDTFSKLAWSPESYGPNSQPKVLRDFASQQFGGKVSKPIADLLREFYRLGTIHKPELMTREWATTLSEQAAAQLKSDYLHLLEAESKIAASIPVENRDAYFEVVGYPARVLAGTGLIFMADRAIQLQQDVAVNQATIAQYREFLEKQVGLYNSAANSKWQYIMPGTVTARDLTAWNSQVRWPWGEKSNTNPPKPEPNRKWRNASSGKVSMGGQSANWVKVEGLGPSGQAVALKPTNLADSWGEDDAGAPTLEFGFEASGESSPLLIEFLPTFRLCPGRKQRVAVVIDDQPAKAVEVPGSSGREDENGNIRSMGVQNNFVRATVTLPTLGAGKHTLKIRALDPGVVIDRVALPEKG